MLYLVTCNCIILLIYIFVLSSCFSSSSPLSLKSFYRQASEYVVKILYVAGFSFVILFHVFVTFAILLVSSHLTTLTFITLHNCFSKFLLDHLFDFCPGLFLASYIFHIYLFPFCILQPSHPNCYAFKTVSIDFIFSWIVRVYF